MTRHYLITLGLILLAFWLGRGCNGDEFRQDAREQEAIAKEALRDALIYRDSTEYFKARADHQRVIHDTVVLRLRSEEERYAWEREMLMAADSMGRKDWIKDRILWKSDSGVVLWMNKP